MLQFLRYIKSIYADSFEIISKLNSYKNILNLRLFPFEQKCGNFTDSLIYISTLGAAVLDFTVRSIWLFDKVLLYFTNYR